MSRRDTPLRVANCSGFFGDRLSAAMEMVEGGPIDVLTGDWLAELTMYVLHKTRSRSGNDSGSASGASGASGASRAGAGYARTFVRQMEEVLATCIQRGIKVVSNAGGLNPQGCAAAIKEIAKRQGVDAKVAWVGGDDITDRFDELRARGERFVNLDTNEALPKDAQLVVANAYFGAAPVAAALNAGADVVVTGRVTDASLVVAPGISAFGWGPDDLDALAGAVVAGHVIECGAQCCGGNYAFFEEVEEMEHCGFPLVELDRDGSCVVTKHPGTGGKISVGTVTAQLVYEIAGPRYMSPDAVARFDTIEIAEIGRDRVRISGVKGEAPPKSLKVAANLAGGWRNSMTMVLTGSRIKEKAAVCEAAVWDAVSGAIDGGRLAFDETSVELIGAGNNSESVSLLRIAVRGVEREAVKAFSSVVVETTLANYPGAFATTAPTPASEVARYWPTVVSADALDPIVDVNGERVEAPTQWRDRVASVKGPHDGAQGGPGGNEAAAEGENPIGVREDAHREKTTRVPLGVLLGARSGDKGGNANVGVWADSDDVYEWARRDLDVERFKSLLEDTADLDVERYELANLRALNFVVKGFLGWGVASNLRLDSQAKGLGEALRSKEIDVPEKLLASRAAGERLRLWSHPFGR